MRRIADQLAPVVAIFLFFYAVSFAAHGQQLQLLPIDIKDGDRAVIFVHGLDGDPTSTFTAAGSALSWGQLMGTDNKPLTPPPPLSGFSTYTLDYRSMFASSISIEQIAQQVASVLEDSDVFAKYNNIWFITHSLGGLVIKRVIIDYHAQKKDKFIDKIAGVFLIAVPSQGAPLANRAESDSSQFILWAFGKDYGVIKDLQPATVNTALQIIEDDWVRVLQGRQLPKVYCAYELRPTGIGPLSKTVVDRIYAGTRCSGIALGFPKNHIDIVKPPGVNDRMYVWVRARIEESLRTFNALKTVNITDASAQPLKKIIRRFSELHSNIRFQDPATGLPEVPETVEYGAGSLDVENAFRLSHSNYAAPTVADLFEAVSRAEPCVGVKVAPSRMEVAIKISREVQNCGDAQRPVYACRGLPCPGPEK